MIKSWLKETELSPDQEHKQQPEPSASLSPHPEPTAEPSFIGENLAMEPEYTPRPSIIPEMLSPQSEHTLSSQTAKPRVRENNEQPDLVAGLDIGSTKICVIIAESYTDGIEIIGVGAVPSTGIRKGMVVNIESTVHAIRQAMEEASKMADCDIGEIYVGIAGSHIKGFNSPGILTINNQQIKKKDIEAVIEAAQTVKISENHRIIHVLPQEYMVDDHTGLQNPLGMTGVRLATNVHIVTADATALHNVATCCNRAGLMAKEVVLESYACSKAVLSKGEMELGVALVDIGGGTTDLAIFWNGAIKHTWELSLGGNNLTSDLAQALRTPLQEAERLKCAYGGALAEMINGNQVIEVPSVSSTDRMRKVAQRDMVKILEERIYEILTKVEKDIEAAGCRNRLGAGIVLTGGTALLPNIAQLAEQVFNLPVRIGYPQGVGGRLTEINTPRSTTAVGLVMYGYEKERNAISQKGKGFWGALKSWLRITG